MALGWMVCQLTLAVTLLLISCRGQDVGTLSGVTSCHGKHLMNSRLRVAVDAGGRLLPNASVSSVVVKAIFIKFCLATRTHIQLWRRSRADDTYDVVWQYVHTPSAAEVASSGVVLKLSKTNHFRLTPDDRLGLWTPAGTRLSVPYFFNENHYRLYMSVNSTRDDYVFLPGDTIKVDDLRWPWSFEPFIKFCTTADCSELPGIEKVKGILFVGRTEEVFSDTQHGRIKGVSMVLHTGQTVHSYLGVRYAKAPVGRLRFAKPEKPDNWRDTVNATELGAACPQLPNVVRNRHPNWTNFDEDCLHLNIYSPEPQDSGEPAPVMVVFHGGGFRTGANFLFPGYFMAGQDAVVVAPNYRLNVLGFGSTEDEAATGNWGLWDQRLALEWVRDNIAHFGGDPGRVTIAGVSAGGVSVGLHLVSPQSKGLFHGAIQQSGNEYNPMGLNHANRRPASYLQQVARHGAVNCTTASSQQMVECLRSKPWDLLWRQPVQCSPGVGICIPFLPVVDGADGFLPKLPAILRAEGVQADVPLLAGITTRDGSSFAFGYLPTVGRPGGITRSEFEQVVREIVGSYEAQWNYDRKISEDIVQAILFLYTKHPYVTDKEENRYAFVDILTDLLFGFSWDLVNKQHAESSPVYAYLFGFNSPNADYFYPEWMAGVPHTIDVLYINGLTLLQLNQHVQEHSGVPTSIVPWTERDLQFTEYIQRLWYNFVKYGQPIPGTTQAPDGSEVTWAPFTNQNFSYQYLDWEQKTGFNYRQKYYAFWSDYLQYITGGIDIFGGTSNLYNNTAPRPYGLVMSDVISTTLDNSRTEIFSTPNRKWRWKASI